MQSRPKCDRQTKSWSGTHQTVSDVAREFAMRAYKVEAVQRFLEIVLANHVSVSRWSQHSTLFGDTPNKSLSKWKLTQENLVPRLYPTPLSIGQTNPDGWSIAQLITRVTLKATSRVEHIRAIVAAGDKTTVLGRLQRSTGQNLALFMDELKPVIASTLQNVPASQRGSLFGIRTFQTRSFVSRLHGGFIGSLGTGWKEKRIIPFNPPKTVMCLCRM